MPQISPKPPFMVRLYDAGGSLKKRWYVEVKIPTASGWDRHQIYAGINAFSTLKSRRESARALLASITELLHTGWRPGDEMPSANQSIADLLNMALKAKSAFLRPATLAIYSNSVRFFLRFLEQMGWTNMSVEDRLPDAAKAYYHFLIQRPDIRNTTKNTYLVQLSNVVAWLADHEFVRSNPFRKMKLLPERQVSNAAFPPDVRRRIRDYVRSHDRMFYLYIGFIYYCFIRPRELSLVQVKHINLDAGTIYLPSENTKNGKAAIVRIPDVFMADLRPWLEKYRPGEDLYLFGSDGHTLVPSASPMRRDAFTRKFARILQRLKLDGNNYTLYSWKHTGAVELYRSGIGMKDLQLHLRHADLATTDKYLRSLGVIPTTEAIQHFPEM